MFNRQWFSRESQIGLTESAIQFERHLSQLDILRCIDVLESQGLCNAYWQRQKKRLIHITRLIKTSESTINVYFSDFWPDMNPYDCQLLDLLRLSLTGKTIRVTTNPEICDIAIYSCYGDLSSLRCTQHATRILFLGENVRPCYSDFDISLTFDSDTYRGRNIYLPLWLLEIDWFNKQYADRKTLPLSTYTKPVTLNIETRMPKYVYIGNNHEPKRMSLISTLQENGIEVDCFGSQSRPVKDKPEMLSKYLGSIVMENSYYPTYQTEKILQAYSYVPYLLYWGGTLPPCFSSASHIQHIEDSSDRKAIEAFERDFKRTSKLINKAPLLIESKVNQIFENAHRSLRDSLKFLIW